MPFQKVTDPTLLAHLNQDQNVVAPNPMYPLEHQGKSVEVQKNTATLPYDIQSAQNNASKSASEAQSAKIAAQQAQEQWNISHPKLDGTEALSGPAYLQQLQKTDPGRAAYIQGLSEGRVPFPGPQMMRSPAGMALLNQVMRADPTIDATNYQTRAAARKNAATGHLGDSDNSFITAIGHLSRLNTLVPETFGTPVRPVNWIANEIDKNFFNGGQTAYEQNQQLAGNELAGAYRAKTEGKQNEGGSQFNENYSTDQKTKNIYGAVDLLMSKLAANRSQFAYGNGQLTKPDFMLLPPGVREQVESLPGGKEIAAKYFAGIPVMGANGPPPGSGPIVPPSVGGSPNIGPSGGGFSDKLDPHANAVWENSARSGLSYNAALAAAAADAKARGLDITTPPPSDAYAKAASYMAQHPDVDYHPFSAVNRTPLTGASAVMNDVAQSGPGAMAGHFANMATAGLPERAAGDQGALFDAVSRTQHPALSALGDVGGAVTGSVLAGKGLGALAPGLSAGRAMTLGDLLYGTGTGANSDPSNPLLGATLGGLSAAGGNVAGRYLLGPGLARLGDTAVGQGAVNAGNRLINVFGKNAPEPFTPPAALNPGQSMLMNAANKTGVDNISSNLTDAQGLNLPYTLADADPRLRALLGSAVRKSPDVLSLADSTLVPRQAGQGERAIGQINSNLAPVGDVPSIIKDATARARTESQPLYAKAMTAPTPNDPQLNEMLDSPAGQQAARNAYAIALNKGENPADLSYATGPNGDPVINAQPNWKTLQYVKQGLDQVITDNQNPVTGELDLSNPANRALNDLRGRFVGRMGELNPDYAAANAKYGEIASQGTAAQQGANATGIRVTPEATLAALGNSGNNLPYFQKGYASNLADMIEQQRGGNPYNLVNGSMGQQAKLGSVFPEGAPGFNRAQGLEGDMSKTYTEALGGSQTAARSEADKAFDNADIAADLVGSLATGVPSPGLAMTAFRKLGNSATDNWRLGLGAAKANQIGPMLLNTDPGQNLMTLGDLVRMSAARKAYLNQAGNVGSTLGTGLALPTISSLNY